MGKGLTEAQRAHFSQHGYVSPVPALDADEVAALVARVEAFEQHCPDDAAWAFDIKCNLLHDWVVAAGTGDRMLDVAEDLLGPDIFITNAVFRIKEPGSTTSYDWHQDSARIEVEPCFVIGYLSITASTVANGCMQVIPGSHGEVQPFTVVENAGQRQRRVARVVAPDTASAIPLLLEPGEAAFFSANLIHGSGPNASGARRIAVLYDYTAARARQRVGRGSGQLVRGKDQWGFIGHEPMPEPGFTRENAARRRAILRAYPENPLMGPREPGAPLRFPDAERGPFAEAS
jgi:hypothetical protein